MERTGFWYDQDQAQKDVHWSCIHGLQVIEQPSRNKRMKLKVDPCGDHKGNGACLSGLAIMWCRCDLKDQGGCNLENESEKKNKKAYQGAIWTGWERNWEGVGGGTKYLAVAAMARRHGEIVGEDGEYKERSKIGRGILLFVCSCWYREEEWRR